MFAFVNATNHNLIKLKSEHVWLITTKSDAQTARFKIKSEY